jgi:hypothetical protein
MINPVSQKWISDRPSLLPDFIIGGAMKSGTSTLHTILNQHSDVSIPDTELHFFDMDNVFQHRDFTFYRDDIGKWTYEIIQNNTEAIWDWYLSQFKSNDTITTGEDSTTYLASKIAAQRIAVQKKEIKLLFLLRHPTKRTYSHYHHLLRSGRAIYTFENMIKYNPGSILSRSLYKEQLEYYYTLLNEKNIKVVLFEDLISDSQSVLADICSFLDIDFSKFDDHIFNTHSHKAQVPLSINLQRSFNQIYRLLNKFHHLNSLPGIPAYQQVKTPFWAKGIKKAHRTINPLRDKEKPPLKKSTQTFLDQFFQHRLKGIDELVGREILSTWFPNDEGQKSKHH